MKKFILILFILPFFKLTALLPPLYQSIREIEQILKDENLKKQLGSGETIMDIKKIENGYLVYTTKYLVQIDVIYLKQDILGPAKFELNVHDKELY